MLIALKGRSQWMYDGQNRKLSARTFSLLFADEPELTSDTEAFRALRTLQKPTGVADLLDWTYCTVMQIRDSSYSLLFLVVLGLISPQAEARQPVYARKAMVVAQEEHAADVGLAVLRSGGNAVDAAVAVGFALAVTHPYAGNIGGGGFMLVRLADGRLVFIDFREKAPAKASHDMYRGAGGSATDSVVGWRAVGVPGTVRGFELAHKRYGHKPWLELVKPAVDLAANGFEVSYAQMDSWKYYGSLLVSCVIDF
jgi:gamma-glutamyltranspeptidase